MAVPGIDTLDSLQGLYRDLESLSQSALINADRLWQELESRVEEFRNLLDKPSKSSKSRELLSKGTFEYDGLEYSANEEFKQDAYEIADALDLDEIEAARLFLHAQESAARLDRSPLVSAIILFHSKRQYLLENIRLCFTYATDLDTNDDVATPMREMVGLVLQARDGQMGSGSNYFRKCLQSMADIEKWLLQISERVQSMSLVGQIQTPEFTETMEFQRTSLLSQHASLGAISYHLIKANFTSMADFQELVNKVKRIDRYDAVLLHHVPALMCATSRCASPDGYCSLAEARELHRFVTTPKEKEGWTLRNVHAATTIWWLSGYSGRYLDAPTSSPVHGVDLEAEYESRVTTFMDALRDGALHFTLAVCRDSKTTAWIDQLRERFCAWLLQDTPSLQSDRNSVPKYVQDILMEEVQDFTESCITNMPDTLRKIKYEEDEQRKQFSVRGPGHSVEDDFHLERFMMLMAYAFDGYPVASEAFWVDLDSNLAGFIRWTSYRQATPRIAAFSELLRSISEDESCADSGHKFLLDNVITTTGRHRRSSPLSWHIILDELQFYATSVRDKPAPPQSSYHNEDRLRAEQIVEAETAMMLECFLQLVAHFCSRSPTARSWFLNHPSVHMHELAFLLCGSGLEATLKASAFEALTAILTDKTPEIGNGMWSTLDAWISGNLNTSSATVKSTAAPPNPNVSEQVVFDSIATGAEGLRSFVVFLHALIAPYAGEEELNDSLPFPEYLGTAYRMPGIDPYVDFVIGRGFAERCQEIHDTLQFEILSSSCLSFIATCLNTFNEELIIFGNRSNVDIDSALKVSSLSVYARLHPFARTMDWMFNDKVIKALFQIAHQDVSQINASSGDSPLVQILLKSIEIIDLVISLQSTYFDIVRPIIKLQSTSRRAVVANTALASYEDAILNNLQIVVDLGLYCGTGHQELVIASLKLLQKLSSSRKLAMSAASGSVKKYERSRIITVLEANNETESIARPLISEIQFDEREFAYGPDSPGHVIRSHILSFLHTCLSITPDRPSIAHLLLGFSWHSQGLIVGEQSLLADGQSLLHALMSLSINCPYFEETPGNMISWLLVVKNEILQIFQILWKSPLSSSLVLRELHVNDFLFRQFAGQPIIDASTLWDGRSSTDPEFLVSSAAFGFSVFLKERTALFQYVSVELRRAYYDGMSSLRARISAALLGDITFDSGETLKTASIFELVDFSGLEVGENLALPQSKFFNDIDFSVCQTDDNLPGSHNLQDVKRLLMLQENRVRKNGLDQTDEAQLLADSQNIQVCMLANNQRLLVKQSQLAALQAWCELLEIMIETCSFQTATRHAFILQIFQLILPKLEKAYYDSMNTSIVLTRLAQTLFKQVEVDWVETNDAAKDRMLQLFRVSLAGLYLTDATPELRQTCAQICCAYLRLFVNGKSFAEANTILLIVKSFGNRLVEILCDDSYSGEGNSRITSLLLLNALITTANQAGSRFLVDAFIQFNYINVVVDNIKTMANELSEADPNSVPILLSFYKANLSLLLRISQVRSGAAYVLNAGLFQAVKDSKLFQTDPDVGLEVDNPSALTHYFQLLLSVLRVINTIVLSRGAQNDQTISLTRDFLRDCRPIVGSIFKRNAKIGNTSFQNEELLQELVDGFTVLYTTTEFLETETEKTKNVTPNFFS